MSIRTDGSDGGVAFPACNEANLNDTMGMSLRDWFAGQVLAANAGNCSEAGAKWMQSDGARHAYEIADAMLEARAK